MLPKVLIGFTRERKEFFESENLNENFALVIDALETNLSDFREWILFCQNVLDDTGLYFMVIWNAGELSPECQSVLLKPLEEKNPLSKMYLMVEKETDLLPTIISRCQVEHYKKNDQGEVFWTEIVKRWKLGAGHIVDYCEKFEVADTELLLNEVIIKIKIELQKQVNLKRIQIMNVALQILKDLHNTNVNKRLALESFMLRSWKIIKT